MKCECCYFVYHLYRGETIKSIATIKGGKFIAALTYGFYSWVIILTTIDNLSTVNPKAFFGVRRFTFFSDSQCKRCPVKFKGAGILYFPLSLFFLLYLKIKINALIKIEITQKAKTNGAVKSAPFDFYKNFWYNNIRKRKRNNLSQRGGISKNAFPFALLLL